MNDRNWYYLVKDESKVERQRDFDSLEEALAHKKSNPPKLGEQYSCVAFCSPNSVVNFEAKSNSIDAFEVTSSCV